MAVGVVVAPGRAAEAVEQARDDVGHVGPGPGHHRRRLGERAGGRREGGAGDAVQRGQSPQRGHRVLDQRAHAGHHRARARRDRVERLQRARQPRRHGERLAQGRPRLDQRRAQVHERRIGAAQDGRGQPQDLVERALLPGDGVGDGRGVDDPALDVRAARRDGGHHGGGLDDETFEGGLVAHELVRRRRRLGDRRVERLQAGVGRPGRAGHLSGGAVDDLLERGPRLRVQRVEDLVEVHRGLGVLGGDGAARRNRRRVVRSGGEGDVPVRDPRERGLAHDRAGAAMQRPEVRVVDPEHQHGLVAIVETDRADLPDGVPAHLHEVALDELPRVLQGHPHLVGPIGVQQDDRHQDDRSGQRGDAEHARPRVADSARWHSPCPLPEFVPAGKLLPARGKCYRR